MAVLLRKECEHLEADDSGKVEQDDLDRELKEGSGSSQFGGLPSFPAGVVGSLSSGDKSLFEWPHLNESFCRSVQAVLPSIQMTCMSWRIAVCAEAVSTRWLPTRSV
ncbi:hypothetical protein Y032_0757g2102 [Ancylostoma ceylanicum]|uniref:Uncharacterized protein n=1 Tax=Ancylostoma ceylanicum TaxID=53326 RepID=A0A016WE50_9BILA|nr:hypothetical protein Y032_0757g2102 [Ancylostoma ceylanicum]